MMQKFDVIIVGAGLVGISLARVLAPLNLKIALIDANSPRTSSQSSFDDRVLALSLASKRILESMGSWSAVSDDAEKISMIHVSDKGHFGFTRLTAEQEKVEALGYVIPARVLGLALHKTLEEETIKVFAPSRLTSIEHAENAVIATLDSDEGNISIQGQLLVAADGDNSFVRNYMEISPIQFAYKQFAVICNIELENTHNNIAYERFTKTGPMALLPMTQQRSALVWTVSEDKKDALLSLSDEDFCKQAQDHFGYRAGRFKRTGKVSAFPLNMSFAHQSVKQRVVLIGNAAHTLHPIAGQGFNLGIRDVAVLGDVIASASQENTDLIDVLSRYTQWRKKDQWSVTLATDFLVRIFGQHHPAITVARNCGMLMMDVMPPLKHMMSRHAMGISGRAPSLLRGIPLSPRGAGNE